MRRLLTAVALSVLIREGAQAQAAWKPEVGIQGGYVRVKPAGTGRNDYIDIFGVPSPAFLLGALSNGSVYAVIPWSNKVAVEPSFNLDQITILGSATTARIGLRLDYALTPKVYAAGGGEVFFVESGGNHGTAYGLQAAVGYRVKLSRAINGRAEFHIAAMGKDKNLGAFTPSDVYGLLIGISSQVGGRGQAAPARRGPARAWDPVLGVAGGYLRTHTVGGGSVVNFSFPGLGGSTTVLGAPVASPPTLFAILPIGSKTAIEPGLDINRVQSGGNTVFDGNLAVRLDYAVSGGWYAAAGGNLVYIKATGANNSGSVTGANLAWGNRFHLTGGFGGRVEINYTMLGKNTKLALQPQNAVGVMFGATMPLK